MEPQGEITDCAEAPPAHTASKTRKTAANDRIEREREIEREGSLGFLSMLEMMGGIRTTKAENQSTTVTIEPSDPPSHSAKSKIRLPLSHIPTAHTGGADTDEESQRQGILPGKIKYIITRWPG